MIWFCSSVLPLGGILMSTWTLPSPSYLWTPLEAIFQNSLALLVTKASLRTLPPPPLLSHPTTATPRTIKSAQRRLVIRTTGLLVFRMNGFLFRWVRSYRGGRQLSRFDEKKYACVSVGWASPTIGHGTA